MGCKSSLPSALTNWAHMQVLKLQLFELAIIVQPLRNFGDLVSIPYITAYARSMITGRTPEIMHRSILLPVGLLQSSTLVLVLIHPSRRRLSQTASWQNNLRLLMSATCLVMFTGRLDLRAE